MRPVKLQGEDQATARKGGSYFVGAKKLNFVSSGCAILDDVLGGGYALGRITNIVGDKSTGKTLLAMEGLTNFALQYTKGVGRYAEAEDAWDIEYARALGAPVDKIILNKKSADMRTVEDFHDDLRNFCDDRAKKKQSGFYVLDSLDGLSDEAEMEREITAGTYGAEKAKQMSTLFRKLRGKIREGNTHLQVISQTRQRIGVTFGRKYSRSGGDALNFYASQVLYIAHVGRVYKVRRGIKRAVGVDIQVNCEKNKIGLPFRTCRIPIVFGYGVDDIMANLFWLKENKSLDAAGLTIESARNLMNNHWDLDPEERREVRQALADVVHEVYAEIETEFLPTQPKY
jgi:recombination protein RecA